MATVRKPTEKEKAFIDKFLELGNKTQAYAEIYKCKSDSARKNANRVMTKEGVKQYYEARMKQLEDERIAKPKEVLEYLTRVMRGQEKDAFGLEVGIQDRTKCAELLGKRYKLFTDKAQVEVSKPVKVVFGKASSSNKKGKK
jgi:phage terminase small subunit